MCILYLKAKKNEARLTYTFASSLSLRNIQHSQSPRISWISWKTTWGTCTRGGIFLRVRKMAVPRRSNRSRAGTRCHGASGGSGYPHTASPLGGERERQTLRNTEKTSTLAITHQTNFIIKLRRIQDRAPLRLKKSWGLFFVNFDCITRIYFNYNQHTMFTTCMLFSTLTTKR